LQTGVLYLLQNKSNNLPGIIFVNGERIEYFVKENNTLRQLRRGTLGTGVKSIHETGTKVYNQSSSKTIPYRDRNFDSKHSFPMEFPMNICLVSTWATRIKLKFLCQEKD
jgi:hypothetical protein